MAAKLSASSAPGRQAIRNGKPTPDRGIDFSDIPESHDSQLRKTRRVGHLKSGDAKQLIAIRMRPSLMARIRKEAEVKRKIYASHDVREYWIADPEAQSMQVLLWSEQVYACAGAFGSLDELSFFH